MEPAVQNPEGRVVAARDDDQLGSRDKLRASQPDEEPVLGDTRRRDVARQAAQRCATCSAVGSMVQPPLTLDTISALTLLLSHRWPDVFLRPTETVPRTAPRPPS